MLLLWYGHDQGAAAAVVASLPPCTLMWSCDATAGMRSLVLVVCTLMCELGPNAAKPAAAAAGVTVCVSVCWEGAGGE